MSKTTFSELLDSPKLISRKIYVCDRKFLKFPYYGCDFVTLQTQVGQWILTAFFPFSDKALYQACGNQQESGKPCQKKVQDQGDGTYRCEKCNTAQPSFNWRMIMRASMADCTDNNWVNMFNVSCENTVW